MSILNLLFPKKPAVSTASTCRDRLQVIIAREHANGGGEDYLPELQKELLAVICKYAKVDNDAIKVSMNRKDNLEVLDVNITLPGPDALIKDATADAESKTPGLLKAA